MIDWESDLYYARLNTSNELVTLTTMPFNKEDHKKIIKHYEQYNTLHKPYITNDPEEHKKHVALLKSWSTLL